MIDINGSAKTLRVWGSERANPVGTSYKGYRMKKVSRTVGLFRKRALDVEEKIWVEESDAKGFVFLADDPTIFRSFKHECGLLKAVLMPGNAILAENGGSHFALFLEGHRNEVINVNRTEIIFRPEDQRLVGGPIAVVYFSGTGTRHGILENRRCYWVELVFADERQMSQHVRYPTRRFKKPAKITSGETTYSLSSDGFYREEGGNLLPILVMWWFLTATEQKAYCVAHPDFTVPEEPPANVEEAVAEAVQHQSETELADAVAAASTSSVMNDD